VTGQRILLDALSWSDSTGEAADGQRNVMAGAGATMGVSSHI